MLPELDALGGLFEANEEWREDASAVRARMLGILSEVADRYVNLGATAFQLSLPSLSLPLLATQFLINMLACNTMPLVESHTLDVMMLQASSQVRVRCLKRPCVSMRRSWD